MQAIAAESFTRHFKDEQILVLSPFYLSVGIELAGLNQLAGSKISQAGSGSFRKRTRPMSKG
jgi:hypothetical protein